MSARPRRTAVKSAAKRPRTSAEEEPIESEASEGSELKAEARQALARLVSAKRQELQRIQLQAKVQQLAEMRKRLQASRSAQLCEDEMRNLGTEESQSASSARDQSDQARPLLTAAKVTSNAKEESRRRMRTLLVQNRLQMLKKQLEVPKQDEAEDTLVVVDSDAETPKGSSKRKNAQAERPTSRMRSRVPVLLAPRGIRLVPRESCEEVSAQNTSDLYKMLGVIKALEQLQRLGSLSTRILGETMVGKAVHNVGKDAVDPEIRKRARNLEAQWRNEYKKRKSTSGDDLLLKRRLSSDVSEVAASQELDIDKDAEAPPATLPTKLPMEVKGSLADDPTDQNEGDAGKVANRTLERASSTLSSQGDKKDDGYRDKVRAKLIEALGKEEEIEAKGGESQKTSTMRDPVKLAEDIEEELHKVWPSKKDAYMNQARSILFNLKDAKNPTFRFKVVVGFFSPRQLPKLTAEDMASDEKNAERAKQRQYAMEALDQGWALKNGQQLTTGMFTCGKCKGNKTTYFQMQTRSSDEPMTTFVTCLTCGNRWKFC
ncbi:TFIIS [Symbiodinium pilosum]|uniref:TFIIS protein n=1 Tax=Symbiodinium pilosum TaxID=2952 RepID=A0A812Q483_SYMPI|nr:TFIIS [Symbiodinium pilosum]